MTDGKVTMDVLRVEQRIGIFYIASISAHDLVHISYADVRRLAEEQRDVEKYLGIQRPISSHRIAEIREYLTAPDATFPTAVILAIDERCVEVEPISDLYAKMTLRAFVPKDENEGKEIPISRIAKYWMVNTESRGSLMLRTSGCSTTPSRPSFSTSRSL